MRDGLFYFSERGFHQHFDFVPPESRFAGQGAGRLQRGTELVELVIALGIADSAGLAENRGRWLSSPHPANGSARICCS